MLAHQLLNAKQKANLGKKQHSPIIKYGAVLLKTM